ncbi:hypothetical protein, partial [Streptomyces mirabilis]|uniref:hypothetical protein n=1 Tax=Streptomyces mirabilis TaxID=68239 RepID=UPI003695C955
CGPRETPSSQVTRHFFVSGETIHRHQAGGSGLKGPRKSDPELTVRRILVHSTANAAGQQAARDKRLTKAAEDLNKLASAAADGTTRAPRRSSPASV